MRHLIAIIALTACAGDPPTAPEMLLGSLLDRHRLLEDDELEGDQDVSVAQVQRLLENEGSALAGFVEDGKSAAQWIVAESRASRISPIYMLARIEGESGLVTSGTLAHVTSATGCACPDGAACDPSVAELGLQIRCAAELARSYLDDLDTINSTISGWGVGRAKQTLEGCRVSPQTRATAALYTYTPWVGAYATCGTSQWGGSSLMAVLTRQMASALPPSKADSCPFGDGTYCGGNGVEGQSSTLYQCSSGTLTPIESCGVDCLAKAAGEDDACVASNQSCGAGNGLYCGGNGVVGNAGTLYRCTNSVVAIAEVCATSCTRRPAGQDDACM